MEFTYTVVVQVERVEGKFASRDEIEEILTEALQDAVESASLSGLGADGTSEYEVTDVSVDLEVPTKAKRKVASGV